MSARKFTEPFDLERFMNGEEALDLHGKITKFRVETDTRIFLANEGGHLEKSFIRNKTSACFGWKMRPTKDKSSWVEHDGSNECPIPWVKHDGSNNCPIPWAKAGEFEASMVGEEVDCREDLDAAGIAWWCIKMWRLTNAWIPVLDETCPIPNAKIREFEVRFRNNTVEVAWDDAKNMHWGEWADASIVAVRLSAPDRNCITTPDGGCVGKDCMHDLPEPDTGIDEDEMQVPSEKAMKEMMDWTPKPKTQSVSACLEQAFADARDGAEKPGNIIEVSEDVLSALKGKV